MNWRKGRESHLEEIDEAGHRLCRCELQLENFVAAAERGDDERSLEAGGCFSVAEQGLEGSRQAEAVQAFA